MPEVPKVCENIARRLTTVKANQRKLTSEMAKLFGDIQCFAADETVIDCAGKNNESFYQINTDNYRLMVVDSVRAQEESHSHLCRLHRELKIFCDGHNIPTPPDPTPQGGGGR